MKQLFNEPYQNACSDIYEKKYQLKDNAGVVVDLSVGESRERVARALAAVEDEPERWYEEFLWAMAHGAIPAGRIFSNAGAQAHKPGVSLINCTVSDTVVDSIDGILGAVHEAGKTLAAGCGIGYEFSTLRPDGAFVAGAGASTSGPLPFMDIYDKMCSTIASAGGRRGAQMATFDISHPDILEFIKAKRTDGRFRQFNLSCLITKEFMDAVANKDDWKLVFPIRAKDALNTQRDAFEYRAYPHLIDDGGFVRDGLGFYKCKVYDVLKAKELWDAIMESTYNFAEPGFILVDELNDMNNLWWGENLRATNPCGEQPLPPYGACLLGSIDLTYFVRNPFAEDAYFDLDEYIKVVRIFTRMLDNVCETSGLPLAPQREELARKRRHGMGYLGLGSAMTMLRMAYGSDESLQFTSTVTQTLAREGFLEGINLAKEKGAAPIMTEPFSFTEEMRERITTLHPDLEKEEFVGVAGRYLFAYGSKYMAKTFTSAELDDFASYGCRFTHHSSIAPTGTIAFGLSNNVSGGIEPSFSHQYMRNIIEEGKKTKRQEAVMSYEFLLYKHLINPDVEPNAEPGSPNALPCYFITSDSITPKSHVDVQAAAQVYIDSSISKTINVATDCPREEFDEIYMYAYEKGLKGCTTFRFNPEAFTGVLVNAADLENMDITFSLEDGTSVHCKGSDEIEYDGEMHNAANLYDAIKEGAFGVH